MKISGETAAFLVVPLHRPIMYGERGHILRTRMIMTRNATGDRAIIARAARHYGAAETTQPDSLAPRLVHKSNFRPFHLENFGDIAGEWHVASGSPQEDPLKLTELFRRRCLVNV